MSSPVVLITLETLLEQRGPHVDLLREAGFEPETFLTPAWDDEHPAQVGFVGVKPAR